MSETNYVIYIYILFLEKLKHIYMRVYAYVHIYKIILT